MSLKYTIVGVQNNWPYWVWFKEHERPIINPFNPSRPKQIEEEFWPKEQVAWGRHSDKNDQKKVRGKLCEAKGYYTKEETMTSVDKEKRKLLRKAIITSALNALQQPNLLH